MERAIGSIKQYRILSGVIPLSIASFVDDIWFICCTLTLFHPPLVVNVDKLSDMDLARIKVILECEIMSALSCDYLCGNVNHDCDKNNCC